MIEEAKQACNWAQVKFAAIWSTLTWLLTNGVWYINVGLMTPILFLFAVLLSIYNLIAFFAFFGHYDHFDKTLSVNKIAANAINATFMYSYCFFYQEINAIGVTNYTCQIEKDQYDYVWWKV